MPNFPSIIPQLLFIDPIGTYGCTFDHRVVFDGATTGGTGVITSAALANFTNQDVGKRIVLSGAGASGAQYVGTISSLNSSLSVNVTPNTTTTVSTKGLQIHTDDLPSWTALINDLNNNTIYYGGMISMRSSWTSLGFTNRSGVSSFLPPINKNIYFQGMSGGHTADIGDYTKVGGTCIAYAGTSSAPTAFGAVMSFAPSLGATSQSLKQITLKNLWIDCRNGDQNEALMGLAMYSCQGCDVEDFFVMDPLAVGIYMNVVAPGATQGTSSSIGEAKDCTRNTFRNISTRCVDNPQAGAPVITYNATANVTLSATSQTINVGSSTGFLASGGYCWVMTTLGAYILVNYTGTGTGTLTGCTISAYDAIYTYTTSFGTSVTTGTNIVQCSPTNAVSILMDGDGVGSPGANTCLNQFDTVIVEQGSTQGPPAIKFRNSDSNLMTNVVINGGSNVTIAGGNRVTRSGVSFQGHSTTASHARNNQMNGGSPGAGGCSAIALTNTGALLALPAGPNYWDLQQFGNGEPIPIREAVTTSATQGAAGAFLDWTPNGGFRPGKIGPVAITPQVLTAGTAAVILGATVSIPPQGFQIGTVIQWRIPVFKSTAAGTAANVISIHYGATGASTDGVIATVTTAVGTAAIDSGYYQIDFVVTALGTGTSGTALAQMNLIHTLAGGAAGIGGSLGTAATMTMTGFNTSLPASGPAFLTVQISTGTAAVISVEPPVTAECISPGNP
jgi:hypothetical protein